MNRGSRSKAARQVRRHESHAEAVQTTTTSTVHVSAPITSVQTLLLHMQRQAGNAAVNRLLGSARSAPPSTGSRRPAVQRHICGPGCGHLGSSPIQRMPAQATTLSPAPARRGMIHVQRNPGGGSSHVCTSACNHGGATNVMPPVQRHSSWEHRALGDIEPEDLQIIAGGRDVSAGKTVTIPNKGAIDQNDVNHILEQELRRLEAFRDHPPKDDRASGIGSAAKRQEIPHRHRSSVGCTPPPYSLFEWDERGAYLRRDEYHGRSLRQPR